MVNPETLNEYDKLIKQGRGDLVQTAIRELEFKSIERKFRLPLAKICRRTSLFFDGLRLLTPYVRPESTINSLKASPQEVAEYAILASKVGLYNEASALLHTIKFSSNPLPETFMNLASVNMAQWEYDKAIENLKKYLEFPLDSYSKCIGRINLLACYVTTLRTENANEIFDLVSEDLVKNGYAKLLANSFELKAQMEISNNNFRQAESHLKNASEILSNENSLDNLFVKKWTSILTAFLHKDTSPILKFQSLAMGRHHFESIRDTDLYLLKIKQNPDLLAKLVCGTPYESFRNRVKKELQLDILPKKYVWKSPSENESQSVNLDSIEKMPFQMQLFLQKFHRDLYRPLRMGTIFSHLFPNEHFSVNHSPNRIYQAIWRLRNEFKTLCLPFEISETNGNYKLYLDKGFQMEIRSQINSIEPGDRDGKLGSELFQKFGENQFSAAEACEILNITRTKFNRKMKTLLQNGEFRKMFQGSATLYFKSSKLSA